MKKILTTLTLLFTLCSFAFAQENDYHFGDPNTINGDSFAIFRNATIYVDEELQTNQDIEIAAFIDNKVCAVNREIKHNANYPEGTQYYRTFTVYKDSNLNLGNIITFKAYNHDTNEELSTNQTIEFIDGYSDYSSIKDPYKIYFTSPSSLYVAQVGDNYYETLQDAYDAATEENNVITLLKDAEGAGVVIDKDVTIDFGGYTYTFIEGVGSTGTESNGFQIMAGNNVTLKNGTLNVAASAASTFYTIIQNYADLTVQDMYLDGTNLDKWSATDGDSYTLSINSGEVVIKGETTIKANDNGAKNFALDACKNGNYPIPSVTIEDGVNINGKVELSGGELYTTNENITVVAKKSIEGVDNGHGSIEGWNTISTPIVGGVEINEPSATEGIHDLYRYDEISMTWEYYKNVFSSLELGRGYLYSNVANIDLAWEGILNIKDVKVSLTYTEDNSSLAGFNMVGNPFAYNITKENFVTTSATLADGYYEIGQDGSWIAATEDGKIAPMSSVLVKTDMAEEITIAAKAQSAAKREASKSYLAINVSNANYSDVAYVSFNEGLGLDKINHRNADVPMISVPVEGKEYAIAKMNQDVTEIPVTFKASTMGEYTISAKSIACEFSQITLIDKQTGNTTNLLLEDYSFIATANDNASRFVLMIDNSQQTADDSHFAYINNGELIISGIEGNAVVRVMDVTGRIVTECNATESVSVPTSSYRSGVYMIQMMDNNGVKVQKVIID